MDDTRQDRVDGAPETADRETAVREIASQHADERGPLMPILHDVVDRLGYVDDADIPVIAGVLNLSRADVHGVVSFYHDFRRTPAPLHSVQVCRGEACQSVGAEELYASLTSSFAASPSVEVREVFCLGNCAVGPSGFIDGQLFGRLSADRVAALISASEVSA